MLYVCRCWRIYHSGGSGDDLPHRKAAEETLRHRLPGVWTQHHTGLHQTGELKLQERTVFVDTLCICVITLSIKCFSSPLWTEISRTRHTQSPSSDDEEGWTAAPHAEEGSLQGQVDTCCVIVFVSHCSVSRTQDLMGRWKMYNSDLLYIVVWTLYCWRNVLFILLTVCWEMILILLCQSLVRIEYVTSVKVCFTVSMWFFSGKSNLMVRSVSK